MIVAFYSPDFPTIAGYALQPFKGGYENDISQSAYFHPEQMTLAANTNNGCVSVNKPVSMMIMNYNSNTTNPYKEDGMLSTKETIDYWLNLMKYNNQILVSSSSSIDAKTSSTIFREDYFSKEENKRVSLIQIGKDRYSLPYPHVDLWPKKIGDKNKQMSIPETVVQFFYQVQYGDQGYFTDLPTAFKNSESVMGAKITNEHQRE